MRQRIQYIVFVLGLLFNISTASAQDFSNDWKVMTELYKSSSGYEMEFEVLTYKGTQKAPEKKQQILISKKGENLYYKNQELEFLKRADETIWIDHEMREVLITGKEANSQQQNINTD